MTVNVSDNSGGASVTINLSSLENSLATSMTNSGGTTWTTTVSAFAGKTSAYAGSYQPIQLVVNATATGGNSHTSIPSPLLSSRMET